MTNLIGYYQSVNVSSGSEDSWRSNGSGKTRNITLQESYTYRVKIQDKAGRESKVVEKKQGKDLSGTKNTTRILLIQTQETGEPIR